MKKGQSKKVAKDDSDSPPKFLSHALFFFDAVLAFSIMIGAGLLFSSQFGKIALLFGLLMLSITVLMKLKQRW